MLADGVHIISGGREHSRSDSDKVTMREHTQTYQRVRIGRGTWIGAGAVVMVDVGEGSIVGAGAVVNKPIPDRCIAVGVPARVQIISPVPLLLLTLNPKLNPNPSLNPTPAPAKVPRATAGLNPDMGL